MSGPTGCSLHCLGTETMSGTRPPLSRDSWLGAGPLKPWAGGEGTPLASPNPPTGLPVQRTPSSGNVALTVTHVGRIHQGAKPGNSPHQDPRGQTSPHWDPRDRPATTGDPM